MEVGEELAFGAHIRKLLLRYSLTHLTTNYVSYTRTEVSELLSECLAFVPPDDPASFSIPVEPFELLSQTLKLKDQVSYDQTWTVDAETRQFIKTTLLGKVNMNNLPTERCWRLDDKTPYFNQYRPLTPILTTRAIRQTPKLGLSSLLAQIKSFSRFDSRFLEHIDLKGVPDELITEVVVSMRERDHLLGVRPAIDKETYQAITSLLQHIPGAQPRPKLSVDVSSQLPSAVSAFLRGDSSPPLTTHCPMSPPIFSRHISTVAAPGLEKLLDVSSLVIAAKIEAEEEKQDLSKAHMLLVDGWNVMAPPPTSQSTSSDTPSLDAGSQTSQVEIDELFALTPPQQTVGKLAHAKMEEYLMPRSCRPGGGRKNRLIDEAKKSLANFLPSLITPVPTTSEPEPPEVSLPDSAMISLSVLGQPPSPPRSPLMINKPVEQSDQHLITDKENHVEDAGLDDLIAKLCVPINGKSAEDWIMHERMDEKETLMMDVPKLTEPNLHSRSPSYPVPPTSVRTLLSAKKSKKQEVMDLDFKPVTAYLRRVTGIQSLNIELPWRPFNFGTSIPRTEEVTDVERYPSFDIKSEPSHIDDRSEHEVELKKLLNDVEEPGAVAQEPSGTHYGADYLDSPVDWSPILGEDWSKYDVILTRAERNRLSGHSRNEIDEESATGRIEAFEDSGLHGEDPEVESPTRPRKRCKVEVPPFVSRTSGATSFLPEVSTSEQEPGADAVPVPQPNDGRDKLSFHALCSPKRGGSPQSLSQDALLRNTTNPDVRVDEAPQGHSEAQTFFGHDRHLDPMGIYSGIAGGTGAGDPGSLLDEDYINSYHSKPDATAGNLADSPAALSSSSIQVLSFQQAPIQPHNPTSPNLMSVPTSALPVANALDHRSERISAQHALFDFMKLRGKATHDLKVLPSSQPEEEQDILIDRPPSSPRGVPEELIDTNTLCLPKNWNSPPSQHRYIASLGFIQKSILLRHLTSADCNVDLVERDTSAMNGVDLIIDPDTGLLFVPLAPLPVSGEALGEKIAELSWDYSHLIIIFEAYSTSLSYRRNKSESSAGMGLAPYAFPAAVMKAVRKLKRTLVILGGMETESGTKKRRETEVTYAYARDVGEAARFARMAGDLMESAYISVSGVQGQAAGTRWDGREWITDECHEDEMDLARVKGMNIFAASMILCYVDLNTFINMEPGARIEMFSAMVGEQRMVIFNEELARRLMCAHVESDVSSSPHLSHTAENLSAVSSFKPAFEPFQDSGYYEGGYAYGEMTGDCEGHTLNMGEGGESGDGKGWQTTGLLMVSGMEKRGAFEDLYRGDRASRCL